jgi:hypothetical protein
MDFLGIPGLLEPDQVRDLLQRRQSERAGRRTESTDAMASLASVDSMGAGSPGPSASPGSSALSGPAHERLAVLRRELNGLVGAWHHRTGQPHGVTHAALRKECGGPAASVATADQLQARIDRIRAWAARRPA